MSASEITSEIATVYAVFADMEDATRIARLVVTEGLAACANILPACQSVWRWQGRIEQAAEVPALFKTSAAGAAALVARIAALHSYEVPAVVTWPITACLPAYAAWVAAETIPPEF